MASVISSIAVPCTEGGSVSAVGAGRPLAALTSASARAD